MTVVTAAEAYLIIKSEEDRQLREQWRRLVNPTVAEALRDFDERQLRDFVRHRGGSSQSAAMVADRLPAPATLKPSSAPSIHEPGEPWSDADRDSLFIARHRDGLKGRQLAQLARCSRQRVAELIGPLRPSGALQGVQARDGWKPSLEALQACGAPLQPLQSAAAALRRK